MLYIVLLFGLSVCSIVNIYGNQLPIVLWNGFANSNGKSYMHEEIESALPDAYIREIKFCNTSLECFRRSLFGSINDLVDEACEMIRKDNKLNNGFHAIGFSQGALFIRGLVQRCDDIKVVTLHLIGGPQLGIYGVKHFEGSSTFKDEVKQLLSAGFYSSVAQKNLIPAQYWHDPFHFDKYVKKSAFLADINCENKQACNPKYKQNLLKLELLMLVKFEKDKIIIPPETQLFSFYAQNNTKKMVRLEDMELYKEDFLGLKELDMGYRLHFIESDTQHLSMDYKKYAKDYLYDDAYKIVSNAFNIN